MEVKKYKNIFVAVVAVLIVGIVIPFLSFSAHFWTKCKNNNLALSQGVTSDKDGLYCNRILYISETFPIRYTDHQRAYLYIDAGASKAFLGNKEEAQNMFHKALKYKKLLMHSSLDLLNNKEINELADLQARLQRYGKNTKATNVWFEFLAQQFSKTTIDPK